MWKAKVTSKTQQLILIFTEVSIYFISRTKFSLNNHHSSKTLKFSRQLSKLDKNNHQTSKLLPHWDPHSYCSLLILKKFCYPSTGCCVHNISFLGLYEARKLILQALLVVPAYSIVHSMWRISSVFSLRNLKHMIKRSNLNTVRLYHAEKGCFGYRPSLQVTDRGECTCMHVYRLQDIKKNWNFLCFDLKKSLFSKILFKLWLIGNRTSRRPIRSVIILMINKSDSRYAVVQFC